MKILIEQIYEGDMGAPYCDIVVIGSQDTEIARISVIEDWLRTEIQVKWDGGKWANIEK